MAIIRELPEYKAPYEVMLNLYPDQFIDEGIAYHSLLKKNISTNERNQITDDEGNVIPMPRQHVGDTVKNSDVWKKVNMDYFYTVALSQYYYQRDRINRNYLYLKGKRRAQDFAMEGPVMGIMDQLIKDVDLPSYVQPYNILMPPINDMVGEKSKRPDISRPKAMDAQSQSEEEQYYTGIYQKMVYQQAQQEIKQKLEEEGTDTSNVEEFKQKVEQMTQDKIKDNMVSYSSEGEKWASSILNALKVEFNLKELFEEGFRDMLICNRQFYHIYENKTKTGFTIDCTNPKYTWWLTTPDKKYIRDAYAAGIIEIMEFSEILDKFDLPVEEIEHLRKFAIQAFFPYSRETNINDSGRGSGIDSIKYDTFDPAILNERMKMESAIAAEGGGMYNEGFLASAAPNIGTFGNRFVVTTAYWKSKKRIGLVTYIDKDGIEQSDLVDDNYKEGTHPREIDIEWGWVNQWYKGVLIGNDIYHVEPLEILDYCPIIGVIHEIKNAESVSLLDNMKPWQSIYDVCLNQVWRYLEKEKGKIFVFNKRFIPLLKGDDFKYSEEVWFRQMEEEGITFIDDSPENLKGASSFNQFAVHDMTMTDVIRGRMELALQCRAECWKLIGMNEQRLGQTQASETATGINTAVSQSYAQTEPYFVQQEYLENQVLQAILDVAKYIQCKKPESTVSYINGEGENVWCKINTELDLKNRDIKLFVTSRAEDQRIFQKLQDLSQAALQNGVSLYEVAQFYTTNSVRQNMDNLKKLKDTQDQVVQQNQKLEQDKQQAEQQKDQAELQQKQKEHDDNIQVEMYKIDTQANTAITVKRIEEKMKFAKENQATDEPDMLDILAYNLKEQESIRKKDIEEVKLEILKRQAENQQAKDQHEMNHKDQKLAMEKKNIESKERIADRQMKLKKQQANKSK